MSINWWTLALQTVNVIVLLWILQRFLFKPVTAVIEQRQQAARQLIAEAATAKQRAEETRATLESERLGLASGREQAFAAMRVEAQKAREAIMAQTTQESLQLRSATHAALQREREDAAAALRARAALLASDMARQLLERLPVACWNRYFIEGACSQLAALAPAEKELLQRRDGETFVNVASADALGIEEQSTVREALSALLGREGAINYAVDKNLIAGVEIQFRHLVIRNHWAADLEKLIGLLPNDDESPRLS